MNQQPPWDTEIDTPATIAVIGGGPCGVEAALYARFLGYSVELFDQYKVGDSIARWGDRPMPAAWCDLASSLGLAALEAHEHPLPDLNRIPTCREYVQQYLLPIARCDLLLTSINVKSKVLFVSRQGCDNRDRRALDERAEQEFRILLSSNQRGEYTQIVDLVFDCSGGESVRRGLASGGGQPIGWSSLSSRVDSGRCDVLGKDRVRFQGKRVLLFGNDQTAVANAVDLFELKDGGTQIFWVIPKSLVAPNRLLELPDKPNFIDSQEVDKAQRIYREADSQSVMAMAAWGIEALAARDDNLVVTLQKSEDETVDVVVDRIIHCGSCESGANYGHNLRLVPTAEDSLVLAEPHYYLLGERFSTAESVGYRESCPVSTFPEFRDHIRRAFGLVGGRPELNLYQTVKPIGKCPS